MNFFKNSSRSKTPIFHCDYPSLKRAMIDRLLRNLWVPISSNQSPNFQTRGSNTASSQLGQFRSSKTLSETRMEPVFLYRPGQTNRQQVSGVSDNIKDYEKIGFLQSPWKFHSRFRLFDLLEMGVLEGGNRRISRVFTGFQSEIADLRLKRQIYIWYRRSTLGLLLRWIVYFKSLFKLRSAIRSMFEMVHLYISKWQICFRNDRSTF